MEFNFSKDERLLQVAAKDFADRELAPKELSVFDQSTRDVLRKMGELGFFGIKLPEEYGGDPGNWVMLGILAEEIAKVNSGIAYFLLISHEVGYALASYGTEEAKKEWLADLIQGNRIGCICATETDAGTDVGAISAKADKDGDQYLVSGRKVPVSFGAVADVGLSFFKSEEQSVTAMLVPLDLPGVAASTVKHMGLHLSSPASLRFNEVRVPLKYLIGKEGEGHQVNATAGLLSSTNKIISGLISMGIAQTALNHAVRYSKQRFAFGKPLAKFEGLSIKMAEDATMIEAGRWLCYRALFLKDRNLPHVKEAAMSGWWCPRIAYQVIHNTLLLHGHAGYSDDHPFQQMLRDVVAFEMISGTEQILKLIIGYQTIGQTAVPDSVSACMGYHRIGG